MTALVDLTAAEIARRVRAREASAREAARSSEVRLDIGRDCTDADR